MPLVSYSIPHLSNGVSQQPAALRLPTSCEEMINGWPSLVTGLSKRPPTEHLAVIDLDIESDCAGHLINRSAHKQYFVLVSDKDIKVVDEDGEAQEVLFPDGKAYLDVSKNPAASIRFLTIGDYTFIVNKEKKVLLNNHGEASPDYNIVPDYTFDKFKQFPTTGTENKIYYAKNQDKFYMWKAKVLAQAVKGWKKRGSDTVSGFKKVDPYSTSTEHADYSYVEVLPDPKVTPLGTKRFTVKLISKEEVYTEKKVPQGKGEFTIVKVFKGYKYTYRRTYYECVVTKDAELSAFEYRVVTAADIESADANTRLNPNKYATVYVTQSAANSYYSIYINGSLKANFLTGNGTEAAQSVEDTSVIAGKLRDALVTNGYSAAVYGSTISISGLSKSDTVVAKGPNGDRAIKAYRDTIKSFQDLPPNEKEGRLVKVQSDPDTDGDDYYVSYRSGIWTEEVGYNQGSTPRPDTMPHVLIRDVDAEGNEVWTFKEHTWGTRKVGDSESNRKPSFIGKKINDIFVFGSRLGFLADENVILSEADNFENFWRTSCAVLLESDRIDIALFNKDVDIINHAIPFNKDIVLMSDNSQYRMSFDTYVSPKTASVQYTTSYNNSSSIKPVNMGTSIYFIDDTRENKWAKVFEYFPRPNNSGDEADDVTAAIPEYIPANMRFLAASPRMSAVVTGHGGPTLYVYKFFWDGDKKVQNAWGKWKLSNCQKIYSVWFLNNYLYMIVRRNEQMCLERVRFDEDVFTSTKNSTAYLDRFVRNNQIRMRYEAETKTTHIQLPYITDTAPEVISSTDKVPCFREKVIGLVQEDAGDVLEIDFTTNSFLSGTKPACTTVVVAGDLRESALVVGFPYTFTYEFSRQYLRRPSSKGGERPILEGRVQLRYLSLEFHDTPYFQFTCKVIGRKAVTATYNGSNTNAGSDIVGEVRFGTGVQRIPLMGSTSDVKLTITNDGPFGNAFGSAEWQAIWTPRSERIN